MTTQSPFNVDELYTSGPIIQQPNLPQSESPLVQFNDIFLDGIASGITTQTTSTLSGSITSGVAYINGYRTVYHGENYTLSPNSLFYADLNTNGTITFSTSSTPSSGVLRLFSIESSSTTIATITQIAQQQIGVPPSNTSGSLVPLSQMTDGSLNPIFNDTTLLGPISLQPAVQSNQVPTLSQTNDLIKTNTTPTSIHLGTVTGTAAGNSANVTNSGTSTAPVLNFTIPSGGNGADGTNGPTGMTGGTYPNMIVDQPIITGAGICQINTLNASGSITLDQTKGTIQWVELIDNCSIILVPPTSKSSSNVSQQSQSMSIYFKQDAIGNRQVSWPTNTLFPSGVQPTLSSTPSAVDIFEATLIYGGNGWIISTTSTNVTGLSINPLTYEDIILADSPYGYWPLNETSGTTAYDLSGNDNNGTYTGTYTLSSSGLILDGNGYVVPSWSLPTAPDNFTLEVWISGYSTGSVIGFQSEPNPLTTGGTVDFDRTIYLNGYFPTGGVDPGNVTTTESPQTIQSLTHLVFTVNNGTIVLYQNSLNIASQPDVGTPAQYNSPSAIAYLMIGVWGMQNIWPGNSDIYFTGTIKRVGYYDYALTGAQVQNHYIAGTLY